MERSISALTYKGSIPEAILEAKKQKKLFVVFIAGSDSDSIMLEEVIGTDLKVAESMSKYCIFLHIPDGSTDAANFRAIYPQKSVPSIAAIGYNGVQLWQTEGYVSAEVLASGLEKASLSLHIQETAATVLTAALASKKSKLSSGSSDVSGKGNSSTTVVPSPSSEKQTQSPEDRLLEGSKRMEENNSQEHLVEDKNTKLEEKSLSESSNTDQSWSVQDEPIEEAKGLPSPLTVDPDDSIADQLSSGAEEAHLAQEKSIGHHSGTAGGDALLVTTETNESVQNKKVECVDDENSDTLNSNTKVNVSTEVHLNIRLPSGVSLQEKFSVTSALGIVKDYVDRNQASGIASYDLAIPYPRKVFGDQDLSKSLSELGLFNRQALIVVPRQRATSYIRGDSSSDQTTTRTTSGLSNSNDGGYFARIKSILSYVNPFSYLGGSASSSSSGQAQTGIWEYSPNPALQNNVARAERPYARSFANGSSSATERNDKGRQPTTSQFGSNIHTLKHDEDDSQFSDRNSFWNGNSTQYGGNDDRK